MVIYRIYADEAGESHFEQLAFHSMGEDVVAGMSKCHTQSFVLFRETESSSPDWHCAPQRQLVILLDGKVEVLVSDGEKRTFETGDIILAEDTHGKGHLTTVLTEGVRKSLFIPLAE